MANTVSGFFETQVLGMLHTLAQPVALANSMLRNIYIDSELGLETWGQTTNLNVPTVNRNNVTDIGGGPIQPQDQGQTLVTFTVNNNKSVSRYIRDWDRVRAAPPEQFRDQYLAPVLEELTQAIDSDICELVTATNFASYTSITGGADTFSRANVATAWANLAAGGAPMQGLVFATGSVPYSSMIADTSWISEATVGLAAAEAAQQRAMLMPAFGARIIWDPLFRQPTAGSTYSALLFHPNAIALKCVQPSNSSGTSIEETIYTVPGTNLRFRIQFWYDPREQAHILHAHCVYARGVARPDYGSYLVST